MNAGATELFVVTPPGLEGVTEREVREILAHHGFEGATAQVTRLAGGIRLTGDQRMMATLLLHLSTASRVLVRVGRFKARGFPELERRVKSVALEDVLGDGRPVRLEVTSRKSRLYHTGAIEERIRRILDLPDGESEPVETTGRSQPRLGPDGDRDREGGEGDDDGDVSESGALRLVVRVHRDEFTLSADASGVGLHRRGYRLAIAKAPMRETLAAALLRESGWVPGLPLADPFCGSGTLPIEAARMARRIPAGMGRGFDAERWPNANPEVWAAVREQALQGILPESPAPLVGSDRDAGAIEAAKANAVRAGVENDIAFSVAAFSDAPVPAGAWVLMNPPYGHRIGGGDLRNLYARLGDKLRDWRAAGIALVTDQPEMLQHARVNTQARFHTSNGGIDIAAVSSSGPVPGSPEDD